MFVLCPAVFPLWALTFAFVERTPDVFALLLSLVKTAVLDETVLPFKFDGMFAFVSITPFRFGEPALPVVLFALLPPLSPFVAVSLPPQASQQNDPGKHRWDDWSS